MQVGRGLIRLCNGLLPVATLGWNATIGTSGCTRPSPLLYGRWLNAEAGNSRCCRHSNPPITLPKGALPPPQGGEGLQPILYYLINDLRLKQPRGTAHAHTAQRAREAPARRGQGDGGGASAVHHTPRIRHRERRAASEPRRGRWDGTHRPLRMLGQARAVQGGDTVEDRHRGQHIHEKGTTKDTAQQVAPPQASLPQPQGVQETGVASAVGTQQG